LAAGTAKEFVVQAEGQAVLAAGSCYLQGSQSAAVAQTQNHQETQFAGAAEIPVDAVQETLSAAATNPRQEGFLNLPAAGTADWVVETGGWVVEIADSVETGGYRQDNLSVLDTESPAGLDPIAPW